MSDRIGPTLPPFLFRASRPAINLSGFSLIEVVIALGIISFAVIGIVGMMPVALKSAQLSTQETDATLIAQRIFSEFKTGNAGNRTITISGNSTTTIPLSSNSTNFIAFKDNGVPQTLSTTNLTNPDYNFIARISISTNTGISNLSQITIDISSPASAPITARTTNSFVTLLGF